MHLLAPRALLLLGCLVNVCILAADGSVALVPNVDPTGLVP